MTEMFAISKAGHDKGQMYVILKEEGEYLYLVDGKPRGVDNPKKKKKKPVQPVKTGADEKLAEKIKDMRTIYNEEIRFAIKSRTNKEVDNV